MHTQTRRYTGAHTGTHIHGKAVVCWSSLREAWRGAKEESTPKEPQTEKQTEMVVTLGGLSAVSAERFP